MPLLDDLLAIAIAIGFIIFIITRITKKNVKELWEDITKPTKNQLEEMKESLKNERRI